jgi:uncharacterized protein YajQ (UPF0234 family)
LKRRLVSALVPATGPEIPAHSTPMPSFDICSEIDLQEVRNAVDQANREISTRFDFKGVKARFELGDGNVLMAAEQEFQLQQMMDILRQKLVKRSVDLKSLDPKDPITTLNAARQDIGLKQGVDSDTAKRMVKDIKASKLKVQAQIQGDQVRVTGKKRDDLQETIALLRAADWGLPIQFTNFRE